MSLSAWALVAISMATDRAMWKRLRVGFSLFTEEEKRAMVLHEQILAEWDAKRAA